MVFSCIKKTALIFVWMVIMAGQTDKMYIYGHARLVIKIKYGEKTLLVAAHSG